MAHSDKQRFTADIFFDTKGIYFRAAFYPWPQWENAVGQSNGKDFVSQEVYERRCHHVMAHIAALSDGTPDDVIYGKTLFLKMRKDSVTAKDFSADNYDKFRREIYDAVNKVRNLFWKNQLPLPFETTSSGSYYANKRIRSLRMLGVGRESNLPMQPKNDFLHEIVDNPKLRKLILGLDFSTSDHPREKAVALYSQSLSHPGQSVMCELGITSDAQPFLRLTVDPEIESDLLLLLPDSNEVGQKVGSWRLNEDDQEVLEAMSQDMLLGLIIDHFHDSIEETFTSGEGKQKFSVYKRAIVAEGLSRFSTNPFSFGQQLDSVLPER